MMYGAARKLKDRSRPALLAGIVCSALFAGIGWVGSYSASPPAGYTGSPLDGQSCTACHSSFSPVSNSASLSLTGLPAQWAPATPYALTLTLGAGTRYGFELTAENGGGKRGVFTAGANSAVLDGGQRYLGHSNAGTSVNSWAFTWTAPAAGAGNISFYLAGNAANNNGANSGDTIHLKNYTVAEQTLPPPAAPGGLAGTATSTGSIRWQWTDNSDNEDGFLLLTSTGGAVSGVLPAGTVLYDENGLQGNFQAARIVRAFNLGGSSDSPTASTYTLTAAPSAPLAQAVTSGAVVFGWQRDNAAGTAYIAEIATASFSSAPALASSQTLNGYASFGSLTANAVYFLRVKARGYDNSETAYTAEISTPTGAAAPSGTTLVAASSDTAVLTWSGGGNPDGTTYQVQVSTAAGFSPVLASSATLASTAAVSGLLPNTTHYLRVRAFNLAGVPSDFDTAEPSTVTLAAVPGTPSAVVRDSTALTIQWSPGLNPPDTLYTLELSTNDFGPVLASSQTTASQAVISGLEPSTTYYFRAAAVDRIGRVTAFSPAVSTQTAPVGPPEMTALSGHAVSTGSIRWSWTVSGGAPSAFILWASTGGPVAALSGAATQYLEAGLSSATAFGRYLEALNISGSVFSGTATAATAEAFTAVAAASSATLAGTDGLTRLELAAFALPAAGLASVSDDPLNRPLAAGTPALIAGANAALPAGLEGPASSVREFLVVIDGQRYTGTFASAVTVSLPYPDANADGFVDGVSPPLRAGSLSLYTLNEQLGTWEAVPGSAVDQAAGTVTGAVAHLSVFGLFGSPASTDLSSLRVFPNPWRPGSGGAYDAAGVTFRNLTGSAVIRIFTVAGEPVRKLEKTTAEGNEKLWDGTNDGGRKAASGVYLYQVKSSGGQKRTGRVAIIR